jgi:hypothetical protein
MPASRSRPEKQLGPEAHTDDDASKTRSQRLSKAQKCEGTKAVKQYQFPVFEDTKSPECIKYLQQTRAARELNGNDPGRDKAEAGRSFDPFLASSAITIITPNKNGILDTLYFCVACLKPRANNAASRTLPHIQECTEMSRRFPNVQIEGLERLADKSAEGVLAGKSAPPAVRTNKRKGEDLGSFSQTAITDSFGPKRITGAQQTVIDRFLLRFIVCCSIAFSILDSRFFIEFCRILCAASILIS